MDPPPDAAARRALRSGLLPRPPLRAPRAPTGSAKPQPTRSTTGSLTRPPYHPHIQHADVRSTQPYIHADMTIKQRALARVTPSSVKPGRYTPGDQLLAYLQSLG